MSNGILGWRHVMITNFLNNKVRLHHTLQ